MGKAKGRSLGVPGERGAKPRHCHFRALKKLPGSKKKGMEKAPFLTTTQIEGSEEGGN